MAVTTKFELKLGPATREAFGKALVELGRENPNVVALDADLSKSTYTAGFAKEFPDRFFECGKISVRLPRVRFCPNRGAIADVSQLPLGTMSGNTTQKGFFQK